MSEEEKLIRLVLLQNDVPEKSASIDPLVERQRHCFENIVSDGKELTISLQRHEGFWRDGFIHLYRLVLIEEGAEPSTELIHFDGPDTILEGCQFSDLHCQTCTHEHKRVGTLEPPFHTIKSVMQHEECVWRWVTEVR